MKYRFFLGYVVSTPVAFLVLSNGRLVQGKKSGVISANVYKLFFVSRCELRHRRNYQHWTIYLDIIRVLCCVVLCCEYVSLHILFYIIHEHRFFFCFVVARVHFVFVCTLTDTSFNSDALLLLLMCKIASCIHIIPMKWSMNATYVNSLKTISRWEIHERFHFSSCLHRWMHSNGNEIKIASILIRFMINRTALHLEIFAKH